MNPVRVRIVGANAAFAKTAHFALDRLQNGFGAQIEGRYYGADEPGLTEFPPALALIRLGGAPLPLIFIDNELISLGGKISIPELRQRLTALGLTPL